MSQPVEVAIAILYRENQFLLQLRDNIPTIAYPGHWGLFGGHIDPGETPEAAVVRELLEEINYSLSNAAKFRIYADDRAVRHVFYAPLKAELSDLKLMEGWDLGLFTRSQIEHNTCFSKQANQIQPIAAMAQRILLDFIESSQNKNIT